MRCRRINPPDQHQFRGHFHGCGLRYQFGLIPCLHHARSRLNALQKAIASDVCNRAARVEQEIESALKRESMTNVLLTEQSRGNLPERVTHDDTKIT